MENRNENRKIFPAIVLAVNLLGVALLVWFAVRYLSHDVTVVNPEAMLPMQNWEGAGWALTLGLAPMIVANILGFLFVGKGWKPAALRLVWFLPGLAELTLTAHYWLTSL